MIFTGLRVGKWCKGLLYCKGQRDRAVIATVLKAPLYCIVLFRFYFTARRVAEVQEEREVLGVQERQCRRNGSFCAEAKIENFMFEKSSFAYARTEICMRGWLTD